MAAATSAGRGSTSHQDVLKRIYEPDVRKTINENQVLSSRMARRTRMVPGLDVYLAIHKQFSEALGTSVNGIIPQAQTNVYSKAVYNMVRHYARIKLDNYLVKSAQSDPGSYLRAVDAEVTGMASSLNINQNEELYLSASGERARLSGASSAGLVLTVDPSGFADSATEGDQKVDLGTRYLRAGMLISVIVAQTGIPIGAAVSQAVLEIATVDSDTAITLTTAVSANEDSDNPADGDIIVRALSNSGPGGTVVQGTASEGGWALAGQGEMYGLLDIVATRDPGNGVTDFGDNDGTNTRGNIGGIDAALSGPFWQARERTLSTGTGSGTNTVAGAFQDDKLALLLSDIRKNSTGDATICITTYEVMHAIKSQWANARRIDWNGRMPRVDGWIPAIDFDGIPIVADRHCPPETLFALDENHLFFFQYNEGEWADINGQILIPDVGTSDTWSAQWFHYREFGCDMRHTSGRLNGILEAS